MSASSRQRPSTGSGVTTDWPARASMEPVPRPLGRALRSLRSVRRLDFIAGDATVAVAVEPQDEGARLLDKLLACDLAVLVLVEIAEIRFGQRGFGLLDVRELGRVELAVTVAISRGEEAVGKALPFIAGKDAVVIGVPGRRPALE